jgi:hypothetical protein
MVVWPEMSWLRMTSAAELYVWYKHLWIEPEIKRLVTGKSDSEYTPYEGVNLSLCLTKYRRHVVCLTKHHAIRAYGGATYNSTHS